MLTYNLWNLIGAGCTERTDAGISNSEEQNKVIFFAFDDLRRYFNAACLGKFNRIADQVYEYLLQSH